VSCALRFKVEVFDAGFVEGLAKNEDIGVVRLSTPGAKPQKFNLPIKPRSV
jgi:hypothetical protein